MGKKSSRPIDSERRSTAAMIVEILTPRERWQLAGVLATFIIMALLEVGGVTSILPFLSVAANPAAARSNAYLKPILEKLNIQSDRDLLILFGGLAFVITTLRNGFSAFSTYVRARFLAYRNNSLCMRMLRKYLNRPYSFFLDVNSSVLSRNILGEVNNVVRKTILSALSFVSKALVAVAVSAVLYVANPALAFVTSVVIAGSYGAAYMLVKKLLTRYSRDKVTSNKGRFAMVAEAFGGIKDIKLMGKEKTFLERFAVPSRGMAFADSRGETISKMPQFILETVLFGGIVGFVIVMVLRTTDPSTILSTVVLYAAAAYRIMPSLKGAFSDLTDLRSNRGTLELLHHELVVTPDSPEPPARHSRIEVTDALVARDIVFRYATRAQTIVDRVTLTIKARTTVGLAGPTGCGKTTLADILLCLIDPESGIIEIDGRVIDAANRGDWQNSIGYVPQHIYVADDSVARNIAFGVPDKEISMEAVLRAARLANIHEFVESELPQGYKTHLGERGVRVSGGQRQRIGIARALYSDPSFLVFDEATSALDGTTESVIMEAITSLGRSKTLMIIAHRLSTLKSCDVVHLMDAGLIVASGTYDDLMRSNQRFREMASQPQGEASLTAGGAG
jgi:ATP-binding cassette, subfamily B, bacterial PglK